MTFRSGGAAASVILNTPCLEPATIIYVEERCRASRIGLRSHSSYMAVAMGFSSRAMPVAG